MTKIQENIFQAILNEETGDYVVKVIILSRMKPEGW